MEARPRGVLALRVALFVAVLAVYMANGRVLAEVDCVAAPYTAWSLVRHGSVDVSGYPELRPYVDNGALHVTASGQWVTIRPIGSALAAVPFVAPLALFRDAPLSPIAMLHLGKLVSAVCAALAVVCFWVLTRTVAAEAAPLATLLFAFGTPMWTIGSQALWTHGPAALGVTAGLSLLLTMRQPAAPRLLLAGISFGFAVPCRESTVLFALAALASLLAHRRWADAARVSLGCAAAALVLLVMNGAYFGSPVLGGYASDNWSQPTPLLLGIAGLTLAPSRGLFVYVPALLVAAYAAAPMRRRPPRERALIVASLLAAGATLVFYARWHDWRGGWAYGPRFLTETMPIACLCMALGYTALRQRGRMVAACLVGLSIGVQVVGITGYSAHAPWHTRHDLPDQGRSLFSVHDTEIGAHTRAAVSRLGRLLVGVSG